MATLKVTVSSFFPQGTHAGYTGNLIESLISDVERVDAKIQQESAEQLVPLTVDEVLDRIARAS